MPNPENREPGQEQNELKVEEFLNEIAAAAGSAPSIEEFESRQRKITDGAKKVISGKKLTEEESRFLAQESFPGEVKFPNFEIMTEVFFKLGLTQDLINGIVEHEKAHFDTAEAEGLNPSIIIKFYKLKDGSIQFLPSVRSGFKEGKSGVSESLKKTYGSPSTPSPSDKERME